MNTQDSLRIGRSAAAIIALALSFGCASLPAVAGPTKPAAPKPAAKPAAAPKPAGGGATKPSSATAGHPSTTAGHTTTTTAGHTTTTTAGHTTTTAGAGHTTTTAGGAGHTATVAGGGAAGHTAAPHGTTASPHFNSATPKGSTEHATKSGNAVRTRPGGHVSDVHDAKRGIDVHHGLDGGRRVSHELPGHGRMYADRGRRGYVQRGYGYHGHEYGRRAYYYHGHEYNRYYRGYGYRGMYLNVYAPGYYYNPGFYGWAYNPWAAPIAYGWGWGASPWVGFYGGFFSPWTVYPSAAFWLTDYIISENLQAAYAARAGGGQGGITVAPTEPWTDTGTQAVQGQAYNIAASGMLQFNGDANALSPPTGRADRGPGIDAPCWTGHSHGNYPDPQAPCLALIGKIGPNGAPFFVGSTLNLVAPASGELFLGVNDWNLSDNAGGWVAMVSQPGGDGGAPQQDAGQTPLTEDVKQQIAAEVKAQLALENQEATQTAASQDVDAGSSGIQRMLTDGQAHVFVVGDGLDLTDSTGAECPVSEGDALKLVAPPAADATTADLVVLASKGGKECAKTATVAVKLDDLQEMQNHMRETIDLGLKDLQAKQGTGGLPAAPASAKAPPTESPYAAVAPPPDPKDAADLQQTAKDADASEKEVVNAAAAEAGSPIGAVAPSDPPAASGPPPSVALGQTIDQVKAILGNPTKTADLGAKTIYYYDGMKVVFKGGKVSDVE
jgi:hypothetical protein